MILILSILICLLAVISFFYLRRHIGGRGRIIAMLEHLAATTQMQSARIEKLPAISLNGIYRNYLFNIQCAIEKQFGAVMQSWAITTELRSTPRTRFYIQGERQEGRLRKVMGLDVVTTNDERFDNQVLAFASDTDIGRKVFNPYIRERFLWAGLKDFTIEMKDKDVYLDLLFPVDANLRNVRHAMEVFSEFLNILEII